MERRGAASDWQFWIDRGGTFTDAIGVAPDGALHSAKLLSGDGAALQAIRRILEASGALTPGAPLPRCRVRLGTTLATNALLERSGEPCALLVNRGFADLLRIGTQERPELFCLDVRLPEPLHAAALEVAGRLDAGGRELEPLDLGAARRDLDALRARGIRSVAIALLHAWRRPEHERALAELARELGFEHVVGSAEISGELGLLARAETACADAYLTPLLRRHGRALALALPASELRFMQSSGGLCDAGRLRGPEALLSGPAGGAVGAARVAARAGARLAIGFDMGGTSTDVCLIRDGEVERSASSRVAGVRVAAPALRIHSVAAGGGSLCRFDGFHLRVGPESAGASPGPLCYGDPSARRLSLTDANFHLGRLASDRFPFPLAREPVERALAALERELAAAGHALGADAIAAGCVEVANAAMADAIAVVSVERGVDPRDCALIGFGGAAGQHVCAVARRLGMRRVWLHPLAGLLSAYGIGHAAASWDGQRDAGRARLEAGAAPLPAGIAGHFDALERAGRAALAAECPGVPLATARWLDLRYRGSESALSLREPGDRDWARAFADAHRARFGYLRPERDVEITTARVRVTAAGAEAAPAVAAVRALAPPPPLRRARVCFGREWRDGVPVHRREDLAAGVRIAGPALVLESGGTVVLDPGWRAQLHADGMLELADGGAAERALARDDLRFDPIRLEVFGNRFMAIAEQMGAVLRNTSVSTNIKERLDFSCAVFDGVGGLVANAPHIPVHLGAMGETVRVVRERFPELEPGDVIVTNDPAAGGSHLPDLTAVTPVFLRAAGAAPPDFFVACRGHHADIGGITPGSMPAHSTSLEQEGVLLPPLRLVRRGHLDEAELRRRLCGARFPARAPDDNVAELEAMFAANRSGSELLCAFADEQGAGAVAAGMRELQAGAAALVAREIGRLPDGERRFEDCLDDGTPIRVALRVEGERMRLDFRESGPASSGNLNAPRAVVQAAVLYVLRSLIADRIPLNGGCLAPVEILLAPGSILDPPPGSAVVGGNVETSQRIVDVLLGALGRAAASQGTMNNLSFGNPRFGYYETLGGGTGAGPDCDGASGVHSHMTNTRITDPELLELRYPVRLLEFALRRGSGGDGRRRGGDGLVRRFEFLAPLALSILSQRRSTRPFGLAGGAPGAAGRNWIRRRDGRVEPLPGLASIAVAPGDQLSIETPGGGGYGPPAPGSEPQRSRQSAARGASQSGARESRGLQSARARSSIGRARDS